MSAQQTEGGISAAADPAPKIIAPLFTPLCPLPGAPLPLKGERGMRREGGVKFSAVIPVCRIAARPGSSNPGEGEDRGYWIPAFAGMTGVDDGLETHPVPCLPDRPLSLPP